MDYQGLAYTFSSNPIIFRDAQLKLLEAFDKNDRTVVCKSRRVGATTTFLFYALCQCINKPITVAIIPPQARFGDSYKDEVISFLDKIPPNFFTSITKSHIDFCNGSRIEISSSIHSFRGMNIDTFITDEFASHPQDTDICNFIQNYPRPIKEIYVSTPGPNCDRGEFYNLWENSSIDQKVRLDNSVLITKEEELQQIRSRNFINKCKEFFSA